MTTTAKKANMMQLDVVKPDVKPPRNGPLAVPSSAPGCLPSCSQRTGCWEWKHACRCEKVGPPCRTNPMFSYSPDGRVSGGPPISLLQPWRSGHLLPVSTHTHTVCCCCSCYGNGSMHWRVKPAFQRKTLCSPLPPLPGTHLMQIKDSPNT